MVIQCQTYTIFKRSGLEQTGGLYKTLENQLSEWDLNPWSLLLQTINKLRSSLVRMWLFVSVSFRLMLLYRRQSYSVEFTLEDSFELISLSAAGKEEISPLRPYCGNSIVDMMISRCGKCFWVGIQYCCSVFKGGGFWNFRHAFLLFRFYKPRWYTMLKHFFFNYIRTHGYSPRVGKWLFGHPTAIDILLGVCDPSFEAVMMSLRYHMGLRGKFCVCSSECLN